MDKQSGYLMMVVAVLLVMVAGLATSFVAITMSGTKTSIATTSANSAYDLAQAGIEHGSYQLISDTSWCNGSYQSPVTITGQGDYRYSCTLNKGSSTLTGALTAGATTVSLASVSGLASFGSVMIDSETLYYDGIIGGTLQNVRRGQNGTTAAAHSSGARVGQAQYIISSQGFATTQTSPNAQVTLQQAVLLMTYYAAGSNVILRYNGINWTSSPVLTAPAGFNFQGLYSIIANGAAVGFNASNQSSLYLFDGSVWSLVGSVSNTRLMDVSCNNGTNCWGGGYSTSASRATLYRYDPPSFAAQYNSTVNFTIAGVSCNGGTCKAVGTQRVYNFSATTATPYTALTNLSTNLTDVDCPSTVCVGVRTQPANNRGHVYYYNGSSWTSSFQLTGNNNPLTAVHCPSTTRCIVVGDNGNIFSCSLPITGAGSCTLQSTPGTLDLTAVHCNSTTDCLAVGSGTTAYRYTGTLPWTTVTLPASYALTAVTGIPASGPGVTFTVLHNQ